ncbi:unnamed protein product [Heterobilharzia americana]|nr:unnamed protein product [Heterobilharzia americana]
MKDNTFRFLRYRDEIKQKVVVSFKNSCPDSDESLDSYFAAAVEKWTDSSASEQFAAFRTRVAPYILSLKLIIFHQDFLCRELKVLWEQLGDNCLAPVLDLVANLACDIREDFFSHIDEFLPLIVGAIIRNAKDAELLGHCFTCVTHLVYFLHRPMLKNIEKVLKFFLPLLSHGSSLVPQFTAECLAFLFRKFEDKHRLLRILENVIENAECLGIILSEMLLGAGGKVHTTSLENLPFLFDTLFELRCEDKKTKNVVSDEQEKKEDFAAMDYDTKQIGFFVDVPFPKFVVAVSHSLSQLVERSPSSEQIGYVIHHLTKLFRHLLNIHSAQYFREYLLLLTGFLMSLTKSDFMPLFEEDIGKILTMLIDHYSSPHVVNLCCIFLHSVSEDIIHLTL